MTDRIDYRDGAPMRPDVATTSIDDGPPGVSFRSGGKGASPVSSAAVGGEEFVKQRAHDGVPAKIEPSGVVVTVMDWPSWRLTIILMSIIIPMSTNRSSVPPANRRRAASRAALLDASATVFARDGFAGATLDAIAAEAGLTKGAIYSSFDGKDDLFFALQERRFHQLADQLASAMVLNATGGDQLGATVASGLPFDRRWNLLFLEFVSYAARRPRFRRTLVERLRQRRRAHGRALETLVGGSGTELRLPPERLARLMGAIANGLAIEALLEPRADAQALLADGLDALWRGAQVGED